MRHCNSSFFLFSESPCPFPDSSFPPLPVQKKKDEYSWSFCLVRNAFVLAVTKCKVHVLQALGCGALEQVVNSGVDDDTLSGAVDCETTDFYTVLAGDVLHKWGFSDNLD